MNLTTCEKVCRECPFAKTSIRGWLGGLSVDETLDAQQFALMFNRWIARNTIIMLVWRYFTRLMLSQKSKRKSQKSIKNSKIKKMPKVSNTAIPKNALDVINKVVMVEYTKHLKSK